ncbi:MAG: hypothetical protein ACLUKO_20360 [Enterocloster bolteae]
MRISNACGKKARIADSQGNVDALLRIEQVQDYEQEKEKSGTGPKYALRFYRLVKAAGNGVKGK